MNKLIECVPNFSEGRDSRKIKLITDAIEAVSGVKLMDVDMGAATNRTVVTIAGPPEAVLEASFQGIKKASEVIDMRGHQGAHARQGATDVCPFIPISGLDFTECIELSRKLAERVGRELEIPVYLYGMSATRPEREKLPDIRKGEYEALEEKLTKPEWKPDYGPAKFNARAGATVIGVRKFLIAYNVNLNTTRKQIASEIGSIIRESGKAAKDDAGGKIKDAEGKAVKKPGLLKNVQATGWYIDEYKRAQVTINIMDHVETPLHIVYETVKEQAEKLGARVTGSELVGLIPKDAMLAAGRFYLDKMGLTRALPEKEVIRTAVLSMGLAELQPFDIDKKIIEYHFSAKGLKDLKLTEFADELAGESPAPGGGSVAALLGSLSAALTSMVTNLTYYKKDYQEFQKLMGDVGEKAQQLKQELLEAVDEDTRAFNQMAAAGKLPKNTDEEKAARAEALEEANKYGMTVPCQTMVKSLDALRLVREVAFHGNKNTISDAGVANLCAMAGITGAWYNVRINSPSVKDSEFVSEMLIKCAKIVSEAEKLSSEIRTQVEMELPGRVTPASSCPGCP
ncbi:MAG: glutamate formimidoyltransferase [Candidatus Wallbacteria bacterium]|nr:glutamate formimidoyltransferase [Candidatus Wallbacteria bacterium]